MKGKNFFALPKSEILNLIKYSDCDGFHMTNIDLSHTHLDDIDLTGANLTNAKLTGCEIYNSALTRICSHVRTYEVCGYYIVD